MSRRLSGVVQDYIHGQILPKIGRVLVLVLTVSAFGSLCYFNYADIGFANAVRLLYSQL
jgi:succinate dehydrogenase (ubiquinone) membrane anchor subunit